MVELTEDVVGLPVVTADTFVVGTATGVEGGALLVEEEPGTDLSETRLAALSSGDGRIAILPGQVDRVTDDAVYLKAPDDAPDGVAR